MTRTSKALVAVLLATGLALGGCSTVADPDSVGLFYLKGTSDGYKFQECINPGETGPSETELFGDNDELIQLPINGRTWVIDGQQVLGPDGKTMIWVPAPGADSGEEIVVSAKPEENQPSGVQMRLATKTNFKLNTFCDEGGGVVREFWEKIGRRYYVADPANWWKNMLLAELVPAQKAVIREVARDYSADPFIANLNGMQGDAQNKISERLAVEFNRLTGGNFFCGPTFNRAKSDCPGLQLIIIGAEYADAGIQAARNEKVRQIELAAAELEKAKGIANALVEEAKGKKNAAAEVANLYNSPGWVALQLQILQLEAVKACAGNANCHMMIGGNGQIFSVK